MKITPLAYGGRYLAVGAGRQHHHASAAASAGGSRRGALIYKPVFPHRPEHPPYKRYRETLRVMHLLHPLCGMSQAALDGRELLLSRWTSLRSPPQPPPLALSGEADPASRPHQYLSPHNDALPPPVPQMPLAAFYQERKHQLSASAAHNKPTVSASEAAASRAAMPTALMDPVLRKRISLAEIDRGLREAPFLAPQCTTNVSCICIRAFNTVKYFFGRNNSEREDERLDVVEFHMLLCFVVLYLEALVLLDESSPIYDDEQFDVATCDERGGGGGGADAADILPLGSCAHHPSGDQAVTAAAEAVVRNLLQPSASFAGAAARTTPFPVLEGFYHRSVIPRIVGSLNTAAGGSVTSKEHLREFRSKFQALLYWQSPNHVPPAFRNMVATQHVFQDLHRIHALMNPSTSNSNSGNGGSTTAKLAASGGPSSPRRGSWSAGITSEGSFRLPLAASFGSHYAALVVAEENGEPVHELWAPSPELCEFLARAMVVTMFEDVVANLKGQVDREQLAQ